MLFRSLRGQVHHVVRDNIEIARARFVRRARGSVLVGAVNETRAQSQVPRGSEIADVCGHHHDLFGFQAEKFGGREVHFAIRLIVPRQLRPEDQVPRQARLLRHICEQRDVAIGERRDNVLLLQTREARDRVRPGLQPVPYLVPVVFFDFAQSFNLELDRKSTRLNSSHIQKSRMPSSA